MVEWIKVTDRLPDYNEHVGLTYHKDKLIRRGCWYEHQCNAFYEEKGMDFIGDCDSPVTHWTVHEEVLPPVDWENDPIAKKALHLQQHLKRDLKNEGMTIEKSGPLYYFSFKIAVPNIHHDAMMKHRTAIMDLVKAYLDENIKEFNKE